MHLLGCRRHPVLGRNGVIDPDGDGDRLDGDGLDATGAGLDACFDLHRPTWSEARLLGRVSHAREIALDLHGLDGEGTRVRLPGDLQPGDVLAVPCAGCFSVGDVRADRER
ncbi:hypothetical protein [Microbacterium binotii]|uniref:Uncharacterized protein n=1 Tax=Microbacterium binotii TaxID=462710 RepID=A0ABN3P9Y4_9MICO